MLERRYRTLVRGTDFLRRQGRAVSRVGISDDNLSPDLVRARLLGNHLRELDRFLNVMAEEAALHLGTAGHDPGAFGRITNTANKVRAVRRMLGLQSPDHQPLLAVRRISDCLHHCGGRVHAPDSWHDTEFTVAVRLDENRDGGGPLKGMLVVPRRVLDEICKLYRAAADEMFAEVLRAGGLH